jgi:hypothetical protein
VPAVKNTNATNANVIAKPNPVNAVIATATEAKDLSTVITVAVSMREALIQTPSQAMSRTS